MLLAAASERPFESVRSGRPPARDVRVQINQPDGCRVTSSYSYAVPSNSSLIGVTNSTSGSTGSGPAIPQTEAALSPRLLAILQYRDPTHKRTQSNTTIQGDDKRTVVGSVPERPVSTVGSRTPGQYPADGIVQRLGVPDQGRNRQLIPPPARSETLDTVGSATPTVTHRQEDLNHVPRLAASESDPAESTAAVPTILVQPEPSQGSSFTMIGGSEHRNPAPADMGTSRRGSGGKDTRGAEDVRGDRGVYTSGSRGHRGGRDTKEVSDVKKPGSQQFGPPGRPPRLARTCDYDPPAFPSVKTDHDPAMLDFKPLGVAPTSSRTSSIRSIRSMRRKGERAILTYG
jgi:hypothetical protein